MLEYVRGHWGFENRLHWSLDVTYREDMLRNRAGHSAENFPRIRRLGRQAVPRIISRHLPEAFRTRDRSWEQSMSDAACQACKAR